MTGFFDTVVPHPSPLTEQRFHSLVVAGLARTAAKHGRGHVADAMGRTTRALDKVFAGSTPDALALLNLLLLDISALDEVCGALGLRVVPADSEASLDFELLADTADLHAEHMSAMRDHRRDHNETIRIAEKARPVVAKYTAIIVEADRLRER